MSRGGARKGAGRKKGTVSQQTKEKRELAARIASEGVTPLEVLTTTMRDLWNESSAGGRVNLAKRMQACMLAEKVAPYVHPKLPAVAHSGPDGGPIVTETRPDLSDLTKDERAMFRKIIARRVSES